MTVKVIDIIKGITLPDDAPVLTAEQAKETLALIDKLAPDYPEDGTKGFIAYNVGNKRMKVKIGRFLTSKLKLGEYLKDDIIRKLSEQIGLKMFGCDVYLVKGKEITEHYRKKTGGISCMTGDCADYTLLYEMNPDRFQLAVVNLGNDSARAIVSKLDNGEYLLDRRYFTCENLGDILRDYAKSQGWYYKSGGGRIYKNGESIDNGNTIFTVSGLKFEDGHLPYMDTLRYGRVINGKLKISAGGDYDCGLNSANGYVLRETNTCESCGQVVDGGDYYGTDSGIVCQSCYEDNYFTCEDCENVYSVEDIREFDGSYYCEICYADKFDTCSDCDVGFDKDDLTEHNGDLLCRDCLLDRQAKENKEAEIGQE